VYHFPTPDGGTYRGLRATRDVAVGEAVMAVPASMLLHSQAPAGWPRAGASAHERLAARLLQADAGGDADIMRPWLDMLPRELESLGAFAFPLDAITDGVQAYAPLLRLRARLAAADAAAAPHALAALGAPPGDAAALASLAWANAIVRTRAFELGHASDGCVLAFVPWLDMANHAHEAPHLEWTWRGGVMDVVAVRPLAAGEEATTSYGARDADGFFLWGGFVSDEENPADTVEAFESLQAAAAWWVECRVAAVLTGAEDDDDDGGGASAEGALLGAEAAAMAAAVDAAARAEAEAEGEGGGGGAGEEDALVEDAALRTAVCVGPRFQVDARLVDLFEALACRERALGPLLARAAAVAALRLRAAQLLAAWPSTLAEDEAALSSGALAPREALCVRFRAAKKRLLAGYVEE
jgi:hypothetical protein